MRIKHFTDSDLDGISCGLLSSLVLEDCEVTAAGPNSIEDKLNRLFDQEAKGRKLFDKIIITDMSVGETLAERIEKNDKYRVRLYDHHKSAEWLNKYEWATVKVEDDLGRALSATEIYWQDSISKLLGKGAFGRSKNPHKNRVAEEYVAMVTSYDTWAWEAAGDTMPKFLNHLMGIYGKELFQDAITKCILEGDTVMTAEDLTMARSEEMRQSKYVRTKLDDVVEMDVMGYSFGVVFAEQHKSELGNLMCQEYDIDVAAIIDMGSHSISYRASKDTVDLSLIAGKFGGGGHAKAAGSSFSEDIAFDLMNRLFQVDNP